MKRNKFLLLFGFILALFASSCVKEGSEPLGDAGTTFLKFNEGEQKSLFFSPFNEIQKINLLNLRRDANSSTELSKAVTVTLQLDPQLIAKYNTDNNTNYEPLPADFFTYELDEGVTRNGDQFTFNFAPGDFSKNVDIQLDGSKWIPDLSKTYAFVFKITNDAGLGRTVEKDTMFTFLSIKNRWDGVYEVNGTMLDMINPAFVHANLGSDPDIENPIQFTLQTISETECSVYVASYGIPASPFYRTDNSTYSRYGDFSIIVEFDPVTNEVVAVTNLSGQPAPSNGRYGQLDLSGVNSYDPATKTVKIKYNMCQPSVVPVAPHIRTTWDETWKFIKERE